MKHRVLAREGNYLEISNQDSGYCSWPVRLPVPSVVPTTSQAHRHDVGELLSSAPRGRYRDALRSHDFALLMVSALIDQVGSWAYTVVLAVDVYHRTHSTIWLAGLSASRWIVGLLLSSYAGVIADRYRRTKVMLVSSLSSGVVMIGVAVSVGVGGPVWILLALSALAATVESPYRPAAGALTPEIVAEKDLAAANALLATLESLVVVVGPAIGGLLLLTGSTVSGVILNAASFFVAASIIVRLRVSSRGEVEPGLGPLAQWLVGFRALGSQQVAATLVAFCALDSMVYGASTVIYAPLSVHLGTGVNGYSYLLAGVALGGVIAAGLANRLSALPRLAPVITVSICLQALPFVATTFVHSAAPAFALQVLSGVGMVVVDVLAMTALQRDLDGAVLSRVLGAFNAIIIGSILLASFAIAAVLSAYGLRASLLVTGIGVPVLGLAGLPLLLRGDRAAAAGVAALAPRVELLSRLDLFAGASRTVLERLAQAAEEQSVPADSVVIREGDEADALWILASGSLTVQAKRDAATARQLPPVSAPGYVGELGLLHKVTRTATVRAGEDSVLLRIDGAVFLAALESTPPSTSFVTLSGTRWSRTEAR
jgi:Transmembrane secretion effector/Cyclic nucleotide-binding domain